MIDLISPKYRQEFKRVKQSMPIWFTRIVFKHLRHWRNIIRATRFANSFYNILDIRYNINGGVLSN